MRLAPEKSPSSDVDLKKDRRLSKSSDGSKDTFERSVRVRGDSALRALKS